MCPFNEIDNVLRSLRSEDVETRKQAERHVFESDLFFQNTRGSVTRRNDNLEISVEDGVMLEVINALKQPLLWDLDYDGHALGLNGAKTALPSGKPIFGVLKKHWVQDSLVFKLQVDLEQETRRRLETLKLRRMSLGLDPTTNLDSNKSHLESVTDVGPDSKTDIAYYIAAYAISSGDFSVMPHKKHKTKEEFLQDIKEVILGGINCGMSCGFHYNESVRKTGFYLIDFYKDTSVASVLGRVFSDLAFDDLLTLEAFSVELSSRLKKALEKKIKYFSLVLKEKIGNLIVGQGLKEIEVLSEIERDLQQDAVLFKEEFLKQNSGCFLLKQNKSGRLIKGLVDLAVKKAS